MLKLQVSFTVYIGARIWHYLQCLILPKMFNFICNCPFLYVKRIIYFLPWGVSVGMSAGCVSFQNLKNLNNKYRYKYGCSLWVHKLRVEIISEFKKALGKYFGSGVKFLVRGEIQCMPWCDLVSIPK